LRARRHCEREKYRHDGVSSADHAAMHLLVQVVVVADGRAASARRRTEDTRTESRAGCFFFRTKKRILSTCRLL
jgi:hypothetical protein